MLRWLKKLWRRLTHSPEQIGKAGEMLLAEELRRHPRQGMVLQNVYIPLEEGRTTEIDLLYLTRKGIFVIESKNYTGSIYGRLQDREWTVLLSAGKGLSGRQKQERHRFFSPVQQNRIHLSCLREYIGEGIPLFSMVVFSDRCTLMEERMGLRGDTVICRASALWKYIRKLRWRHWHRISYRELKRVYAELEPLTHVRKSVRRQHIRDVKERQRGEAYYCPECGAPLVLRVAQKGPYAGKSFYGCSNYPECRYIWRE